MADVGKVRRRVRVRAIASVVYETAAHRFWSIVQDSKGLSINYVTLFLLYFFETFNFSLRNAVMYPPPTKKTTYVLSSFL